MDMRVRYLGGARDTTLVKGEDYNAHIDRIKGVKFLTVLDNGSFRGLALEHFEVVGGSLINIKQWSDLERLRSTDKWGNRTRVEKVSENIILISTFNGSRGEVSRVIYKDNNSCSVKGGRERVLEELALCGFNVKFTGTPRLTMNQRTELRYMKDILKHSYIARDGCGDVLAHSNNPKNDNGEWFSYGEGYTRLKYDYDFLSLYEGESIKISELLTGSKK